MGKQLTVLDRVRVATPCHAPWKDMVGDERVRHCKSCDMKVFNLSEMNRADAERLVTEATGRTCVRYYQRADGTMLTADCPVGLRRLRRATVRMLAAAVASFVFIGTTLVALARGERGSQDLRVRYFEPFGRITAWVDSLGVFRPAAERGWFTGNFDLTPTHQELLEYPKEASELRAMIEGYLVDFVPDETTSQANK